jgi:pimeloyl-ACP methyl ester carboxylesterase
MDIALVHGAYHGAWCWDFLRPELERKGHRVITMDLPISDPASGATEYAAAIDQALPSDSVPMLVGHSMAGLVIPLVAARRPIHRLVFLSALLPSPGRSANDQRDTEAVDGRVPPASAEWVDLGDDVWMVGPTTATELFFQDAPKAVARWATQRLRPQAYRVFREATPLERWPDVPSSAILCRDDRAVNPDWVRASAHDRLGVAAIELGGGHSPFLTRAAELATVIDSLA